MLTFDPEAHRYFWNGQPVPGVTSVLAPLTDYSRIPADRLERARQEGIAIHKTVELHAKGDLDEDSLPDWLRPRLAAFKKFMVDTQFEIRGSEQQVYHSAYGYAGTLDLAGAMVIPEGRRTKRVGALIDVKRSFAAGDVIGYQLAAYMAAVNDTPAPTITHRYALQLREDGTYRLEHFPNPNDFAAFLTCLNFRRLMEKHRGNH